MDLVKKTKRMLASKRGQAGAIGAVVAAVLGIVILIFTMFMGYKFGSVLLGTETAGSAAYNATQDLMGTNGLGLAKSLVPLIILGIFFSIILVVLGVRRILG